MLIQIQDEWCRIVCKIVLTNLCLLKISIPEWMHSGCIGEPVLGRGLYISFRRKRHTSSSDVSIWERSFPPWSKGRCPSKGYAEQQFFQRIDGDRLQWHGSCGGWKMPLSWLHDACSGGSDPPSPQKNPTEAKEYCTICVIAFVWNGTQWPPVSRRNSSHASAGTSLRAFHIWTRKVGATKCCQVESMQQ